MIFFYSFIKSVGKVDGFVIVNTPNVYKFICVSIFIILVYIVYIREFVKLYLIIFNPKQNITMFFRTFCLLIIAGWFQAQCYVTVPSIYKKVEVALQDYSSREDHNPVIFSLLNVLIYDKRAKAFITNEAIEKSLEDIKKFNEHDEQILREIIYGKQILLKENEPSIELKEDIQSALDTFFSHPNLDDYNTFDLLSNKKNL